MKKIPIGISDFEEIIEKKFYYVDKTLLIDSVLNAGSKAILVPRPRRFGKTLNMSMLQYFFEKKDGSKAHLFEKLAIHESPSCMQHQGHYPVIFLTFKALKHDTWIGCNNSLIGLIIQEYRRHIYVLQSDLLLASEKHDFNAILERNATSDVYESALKHLTHYLYKYYGVKPIILIDEYDTPIHAGYIHGYYNNIIMFMRNFLGEGLKDNNNLEFAVMTGILRVAKESIFSGLNNLQVCSLIDEPNSTMFGFTESEVATMLEYYSLSASTDQVRTWYNGYRIGSIKLYNPWSINNFVNNQGVIRTYWVNTSSNDLIRQLIATGAPEIKQEFEYLMTGTAVRKRINDNINFQQLESDTTTIWNFLLMSGYLTFDNLLLEDLLWYADVRIPNKEVMALFFDMITQWFGTSSDSTYNQLLKNLVKGNIEEFKNHFYEFVESSFSVFDVTNKDPERFYHAFVLGMVASLQGQYDIKSNRESGFGRYDVILIPRDKSNFGVIFEFKKVNTRIHETLEQAADRAITQIKDKRYSTQLRDRGIANIIELGIAFKGKKMCIKHVD